LNEQTRRRGGFLTRGLPMERQKFRTKPCVDYEDQRLRLGFLDLSYSPGGIALDLAKPADFK